MSDQPKSQPATEQELLRGEAAAVREAVVTDRENAATNREHAVEERESISAHRESVILEREAAADLRDQHASERDGLAEGRDVLAGVEDDAAAARDALAIHLERREGAEMPKRLLHVLSANRVSAAGDRLRAAGNRTKSSGDRSWSLADREASKDDRAAAADDRATSLFDELTGALRRGHGLFELDREVERAHRSSQPFVLGFLDVNGLKAVNDTRGHQAGDVLLRTVVAAIRSNLRPYDPIVRLGGDEFLCGLAGLPLSQATTRLADINSALAYLTPPASVTIGVAILKPDELLASLIARADADLYRQRNPETPAVQTSP